jgi:hypothetical protein
MVNGVSAPVVKNHLGFVVFGGPLWCVLYISSVQKLLCPGKLHL